MKQINIGYDASMPPPASVSEITAALENVDAAIVSVTDVPSIMAASHQPPPSLLTKAANFATSAARHVAAGMPQCTQEQIDARFAICQGCEHYDGKACRLCGCPVVREQAYISKLSWAGEKCPVGKWGPVTG